MSVQAQPRVTRRRATALTLVGEGDLYGVVTSRIIPIMAHGDDLLSDSSVLLNKSLLKCF